MRRQNFFTEIVDLGHEIFEGMPKLSGVGTTTFFPFGTFQSTRRLSGGRVAFAARMILMSEHSGTHFDAPYHFDENGATVDQWPLEKLILPGHLLDFTQHAAGQPILPKDFEAAETKSGSQVAAGTAVIAWTGQDKSWGAPGFTTNRPYVPAESAQWLVDRNVTLFGTDLIGIDNPEEYWDPTHITFLKNGLPMVQQLCNLERLVDKEFVLVVLPLKMKGGTASPVRPVALVL